jgi:rhodanese-related sulfurtransferase
LKSKLINAIQQAIGIVLIAAFLGLTTNIFHPRGVKIASKRPSLKFAADTVSAMDLPNVSVTVEGVKTNKNSIETAEPLLITTAQVLQLKEDDLAIIIDARAKAEFLKSHIPGALNLSYKNLSQYKARLDSLPQDKWLVCYCDGPPCDQAERLAHELILAGYDLVAVYFDGLDGWKKSGYEIGEREASKNEN